MSKTLNYINYLNIFAPTIRAAKYIKAVLTELKGEINNNIIIIEDYNTGQIRQRIDKETVDLNNTIDQMDLTDK